MRMACSSTNDGDLAAQFYRFDVTGSTIAVLIESKKKFRLRLQHRETSEANFSYLHNSKQHEQQHPRARHRLKMLEKAVEWREQKKMPSSEGSKSSAVEVVAVAAPAPEDAVAAKTHDK